jgi:hypothetical protein
LFPEQFPVQDFDGVLHRPLIHSWKPEQSEEKVQGADSATGDDVDSFDTQGELLSTASPMNAEEIQDPQVFGVLAQCRLFKAEQFGAKVQSTVFNNAMSCPFICRISSGDEEERFPAFSKILSSLSTLLVLVSGMTCTLNDEVELAE